MSKKLFYFFIAVSFIVGGGYFLLSKQAKDFFYEAYCPFCDPKVLNAQTFYEDDLVLALYTHKPIMPGHSLIIPKRHVERFELLTDAEITQIGEVIKKVNLAVSKAFDTSSYLLLQKNGYEVGQTVRHIHVHYIPRQKGDDSILKFLLKMFIVNVQKPISSSEMNEIVNILKEEVIPNATNNFIFEPRESCR